MTTRCQSADFQGQHNVPHIYVQHIRPQTAAKIDFVPFAFINVTFLQSSEDIDVWVLLGPPSGGVLLFCRRQWSGRHWQTIARFSRPRLFWLI